MGAVILRFFQFARWLGILILFVAALPAAAQRQPKKSPHGNLNIPCENCHTATSWAPIRAVPEFNHDSTRFPLRGMHEKVSCVGCHVKPVFTDVGKDCANCHADIHRGQFGANCAQCHTVNGWQVNVQQISQHFNRFPLLGMHAVVQCDECHKNAAAGVFTGQSTDCQTCHMAEFNATTNPAHAASNAFPASQCKTCHTNFDNWANANFNHDTTGFHLDGAHLTTACVACHVNNNYNLAGIAQTNCGNSQCHLATWQQTNNPAHASAPNGFPLAQCSTCHNTSSWNTATGFDHSTTGFLLTQGHANLQCAQCHINNNYTLTIAATACGNSQCHLTTWQQTNQPVHSTAGAAFGAANCANCHTPAGWTAASFDHSVTGFTLVGTHMSPTPTPCASCHVNNNYTLSSADCMGCHSADYQRTTTLGGNVPNHVTANFPSTASACAACHPITTWAAGTFDHSSFGFPLTQGHSNLQCTQCHINGNYSLQIAATDCANSQCHLTTWQQTNNPVHSTAGSAFAANLCVNCHTTAGWTTANFNHNNVTPPFPLTGAHATTVTCVQCHTGGNYALVLPTTCYGCHSGDYNSTANLGGAIPNHVSAGFPQDCTLCHTTTNWTSSTFNHNATAFPLTGLHVSVACQTCHIGNNYAGTLPTTCGGAGCHLTTWQGTTTPPHQIIAATFSAFAATNCSNCHTTSVAAFATATWDHGTTGFALTGAHLTGTCISCHIANNYALASGACWGCHQPEYNSTATLAGIPNHVTGAFPQDCTLCHSTVNWTTSTFNHNTTAFPLTGAHATTVTCAQCHTDNYKGTLPTTCDGCHDALYQSTATIGGSVPNHVALAYPKTCDSCHTTTAWTGAIFNHSTTGFPLVGAHVTTACNLCHTSSAVPPTDCYSCHTAKWTSTQTLGGSVPNHVAAALIPTSGFTTAGCSGCHTPSGNWLDGVFNHPSSFPTTHGGNAAGGVCTICHTNANDYTVFQCIGCHTDQTGLAQTHSGNRNYVYASANCYACHPNAR